TVAVEVTPEMKAISASDPVGMVALPAPTGCCLLLPAPPPALSGDTASGPLSGSKTEMAGANVSPSNPPVVASSRKISLLSVSPPNKRLRPVHGFVGSGMAFPLSAVRDQLQNRALGASGRINSTRRSGPGHAVELALGHFAIMLTHCRLRGQVM